MVSRKSFLFYASVLGIALAMTACGKGFKLKEDNKKPVAAPQITFPVSISYQSVSPLLELASAQSADFAALINDPANQGKIQIQPTIGFIISQLNSGDTSGHDSVLYLTLTATTADGKTASSMITSTSAEIAYTNVTSNSFDIEGYWTLNRANGNAPFYIGIQGTGAYLNPTSPNSVMGLKGSLFANFSQEGAQTIANFNENICTLVSDVSFLQQLFYDKAAIQCPGGK